jgi:hypothetical protein
MTLAGLRLSLSLAVPAAGLSASVLTGALPYLPTDCALIIIRFPDPGIATRFARTFIVGQNALLCKENIL